MLRELSGCTNSVTRGIRSAHVIVDCAHYTTEGRREEAPLTMPEAADRLGGEGFVWLALRDPSEEELTEVAQRFDLPPLAVEDAHESHQRPKIEDYDEDWFVVLKAATYDHASETVEFDEIQMFAGPSFAVVIRGGATNHLEGARKRLADRPHLLAEGPIAVVWAVLDTVVDDYEPVLDGLEGDLEDLEKAIFEEGRDQTQRIYFLRRELGRFFRAVHPLLNALQELSRDTSKPETTSPMREYFRDVERPPRSACRRSSSMSARRARRSAEREPRRDLRAAERHRAQGLGLGGDRDRPDAHREHLRHELRAHARAALGHRLSGRDRPHGRSLLHPLALPASVGLAVDR